MPEIPDREKLEAELARRFASLSKKQRGVILNLLGDPPDFGNVPAAVWGDIANDLSGSFIPFLSDVYRQVAEGMSQLPGLPVGVDWGLINERAVQWASQHTGELIVGVTDHTKKIVSNAVSIYLQGGVSRADFEAMIGRAFSPARASAIAVTEITKATSAATLQIGEQIKDGGIEMTAVWKTRHDDLTCPICRPLNGERATTYIGKREPYWKHPDLGLDVGVPPAHVNCRCWFDWELPKLGQKPAFPDRYKHQHSINKCEDYARDVLGIKEVSYEGMDIPTANAWNKALFEYKQNYPDVMNLINATGSDRAITDRMRQDYIDKMLGWNYTPADAKARAEASYKYLTDNVYACYMHGNSDITRKYQGVFLNPYWNSETMTNSLIRDVINGYHPKGCDTLKSLMDHEMGHVLDRHLNLSKDKTFIDWLSKNFAPTDMKHDLSRYAMKNFDELVAEGWASFMNSPNPGQIARKVGKEILARLEALK